MMLAAGAVFATLSADTHPFSVRDMLAMKRISDPQISPDGQWVLFGLRETDLEADRGRTDLWRMRVDGSDLQRLTTDAGSEYNARFSPDGSAVYFLSGRSGSAQVWKLPLTGGEAQQVTDLPLGVGNMVIAPGGRHLAFTMEVFVDCDTVQCTVDRLKKREEQKHSGMVYENLLFRHWDHWKDGRRSHLFVMPLSGGDPVDVTKGMDADTPSKPFGGPEEITFTPDGRGVVFAARDVGREEAWSTDFDLFVAPVDGSSKPRKLTKDNRAWDTGPAFSPDGKTLAYLAMARPGFESDRFRIKLMSWPDGKTRTLTEAWDRSPGSIAWAPDGRSIYAVAANLGQRSLFRIDVESGAVTTVVEQGAVRSIGFSGKHVIYGRDHLNSPVELYRAGMDGSNVERISGINDAAVAAAEMGEPEQFTFKGWNNETVHAYVVKPLNFNPKKKYPVAFLIHGGPQGSFGNNFHYRWNPQAYVGAGYAAVMVDFHGSIGYGQAFTDSISGDWGGKPLEDLQKGLAAALEKYPWLDGERVGALGASYGGYMINWIAGNWPDRFKCLVNHDGNIDERMAYYDTEELWFPEWERGGTPWEVPEAYSKHNPIDHVAKWKTPMLVIHGALDYRVVDVQGMATFTALQRKGIPSKFLYFPDENHWVLKPNNSIFWHDTVIGWLDRWVK
ncbi:peptidase S9 [Acidobacteria bacterium Mor1]|nr:peptidase S9 [Acidobacteria bacterium Mor1]